MAKTKNKHPGAVPVIVVEEKKKKKRSKKKKGGEAMSVVKAGGQEVVVRGSSSKGGGLSGKPVTVGPVRGTAVSKILGMTKNRSHRRNRSFLPQRTKFTQDFECLMAYLCDPYSFAAIRIRSELAPFQTAVANPWNKITVPWLNGNAQVTYPMLPVTDSLIFIFRNPLCSTIFYDPNYAGNTWTYSIFGSSVTSALSVGTPAPTWALGGNAFNPASKTPLHAVVGKALSSYAPHGANWFAAGVSKQPKRFFWMQSGDTLVVQLGWATIGSVSIWVSLDIWTSEGGLVENVLSSTPITSGTSGNATITLGNNWGYFAANVVLGPSSGTLTSLQVTSMQISGTRSVWCHQCVPGIDSNLPACKTAKVVAACIDYKNTAQPLLRAGICTMLQAPQGEHWTNFIGANAGNGVARLLTLNGDEDQEAVEGAYSFMKPTQPSDFDFIEAYDVDDSGLCDSYWPLENDSSFLIMGCQIPNTAGAQVGYWIVSFGVEYQTTDKWREIDYPTINYEATKMALVHLADIPQYHKNDVHWNEIWEAIKNVGSGIMHGLMEYGPRVANGAAAMLGFGYSPYSMAAM